MGFPLPYLDYLLPDRKVSSFLRKDIVWKVRIPLNGLLRLLVEYDLIWLLIEDTSLLDFTSVTILDLTEAFSTGLLTTITMVPTMANNNIILVIISHIL